jgi:hypothetical protein
MKKENLTKEALIALWTRSCKESKNRNDFSFAGSNESPFYVFSLNDDILLSISFENHNNKTTYKISVIFGQFVEYCFFELDESEFKSLLEIYTNSQNIATKKEVESIIQKNENVLLDLISESLVN